MVYFPVRKCYHVAKVCALLVLVVTILALFEQWRGGKRSAKAELSDPDEAEYERQIVDDETRIIPGLGDGGEPALLTGLDNELGEASEKKYAMNVHLSDRIAYNRSLKDYRNPACTRVLYDAELPSASVILIFHNEPYSVVIRTIWSVINSANRNQPWYKHAKFIDRETGRKMTLGSPGQDPSSPLIYLKEIILVDDNSTLPELKGKLSHYVRTRLPPDLIKILRLPDRIGLTRARLAGARYSTGDVMVVLDAHCEVQEDWLRPLLQEIKNYPHAVVVPIIDVIDSSNFFYSVQNTNTFQVGGFTFTGHFTWVDVPEREKKRRGSDISPTWSPTMAGGLFAINRQYYWEIGAYDEQMAGWGGENLEMSFRIWQCGGTLETIPCSRVGHVFRSFHPYGLPAASDTHGINTARMAEVWMDEYAELFYMHRPDLRNNPKIGDVTHRKVLREKLKCKSFQWFLDNIYKEKFVPVRDVYGYGRFKNVGTNQCLDTMQRSGPSAALGSYPCHDRLQATQYLSLSADGQLRDEENCAHPHHNKKNYSENGRIVVMSDCRSKQRAQKWIYLPTQQLQHVESRMCLESDFESGSDVVVKPCDNSAQTQKWKIDFTQDNDYKPADYLMPNDKLERLRHLRGQRRISRSLLSYTDLELEPPLAQNQTRRRSHKKKHHIKRHSKKRSKSNKKRIKNKFILKLVRTLMNDTDEHLEVDIHCKHKQLYPNNTFVRDLVTILNDKNIKVINNGRVFERNKVTDLDAAERPKEMNKMEIEQRADTQVLQVQPSPNERHKYPGKRHRPSHKDLHLVPIVPEVNVPPQTSSPRPKPKQPGSLLPNERAETTQGPRHRPRGSASNNIIVEDFAEIKPLNNENAPTKHRKRKRKKVIVNPTASPADPHTDPHSDLDGDREELMSMLTNTQPDNRIVRLPLHSDEVLKQGPLASMEDSPMMDTEYRPGHPSSQSGHPSSQSGHPSSQSGHPSIQSGHPATDDDDIDDKDWTVGLSQFRSTSNDSDFQLTLSSPHTHAHSHRDTDTDMDTDTDTEGTHKHTPHLHTYTGRRKKPSTDEDSGEWSNKSGHKSSDGLGSHEAPVKVVMKSNLTFNLGDEFFKWGRNRKRINDLADDLSIPTNMSRVIPIIHDWVKLRSGTETQTQTRRSKQPPSGGREEAPSGGREEAQSRGHEEPQSLERVVIRTDSHESNDGSSSYSDSSSTTD